MLTLTMLNIWHQMQYALSARLVLLSSSSTRRRWKACLRVGVSTTSCVIRCRRMVVPLLAQPSQCLLTSRISMVRPPRWRANLGTSSYRQGDVSLIHFNDKGTMPKWHSPFSFSLLFCGFPFVRSDILCTFANGKLIVHSSLWQMSRINTPRSARPSLWI